MFDSNEKENNQHTMHYNISFLNRYMNKNNN